VADHDCILNEYDLLWLTFCPVAQRDLKPQNLLLSCDGAAAVIKIADFGFARHLQPARMANTMCGSPLYMAPEILQNRQYDSKADLWSVGTILFELVRNLAFLHVVQLALVELPWLKLMMPLDPEQSHVHVL
jgi:serine/threonine protein kinase